MQYDITERLEYLRQQIRNENISYGEIAELQSLASQIDPSDVELLEWAGVPEFDDRAVERMILIVTVTAKEGEEMPDVLAVADTVTAAVDNAPFALSFDMTFEAGV